MNENRRRERARSQRPRWAAPLPAWGYFFAALFVSALSWRIIVLLRLSDGPLLAMLSADSLVYWEWAGEIRSGRWLPDNPFFLGALYPYWLAFVRALVGDSILHVLWVQAVLGSLSVALLADATRIVATPRAGIVVGVFLAGYGMAVYFDSLILSECLIFFLGSLALWLLVRSGMRSVLAVGTIVAFMSLARPIFLLVLLPYGLHVASRSGIRTLGMLLLVPFLLSIVTGYHHWRVDGRWMPFTYSGGYNFYVGNGPLANGTYVPFANATTTETSTRSACGGIADDGRDYLVHQHGVRLSPTESSGYWNAITWRHVVRNPARAARLFFKKILLLVNHRELPQIVDPGSYERAANGLGWPIAIGFAVLAIVGTLGAIEGLHRGLPATLVLGWLVTVALGTAAFFVVDRYRFHLVPPLAILAGIGVERLLLVRRGSYALQLMRLAAASVTAVVVFAPVVPHSAAHAEWAYATTLGKAWLAKGDAARAVTELEKAVAVDVSQALPGAETVAGRLARGAVYENLGIAYSRIGDVERSISRLEIAVALVPDSRSTRVRYAEELALFGAIEPAASQLQVAGWSRNEAAQQLAEEARNDPAQDMRTMRRRLTAATRLAPGLEQAVIPLVRLEIATGQLDSALAHLALASANGVDADVVRVHQAWVLLLRGDRASASRVLEAIPEYVRRSDPRVKSSLEQFWRNEGGLLDIGR